MVGLAVSKVRAKLGVCTTEGHVGHAGEGEVSSMAGRHAGVREAGTRARCDVSSMQMGARGATLAIRGDGILDMRGHDGTCGVGCARLACPCTWGMSMGVRWPCL